MPIDPQNTLLTVQAGLAQLSTLIVSYSFSAIGAIILLVVGYLVAGLAERSISAGLGHIHGFDATLQNIAAGIMLLALRPFRIGEYVEVGAISGTVEEIGLFATKLRTTDGVYVLAPNSTLWNQPVRNFTRNGVRRGDITLSIGSWNDIDLAQKTMLGVAGSERRVKREPAPIAFVATVGDASVAITLRYWTTAADFFATQIDLTKRVKQAFDAEAISVPAPPPGVRQEPSATRQ